MGLIADLSGSTTVRQVIRVWSRLLAVLIEHWLLLGTVWGDPRSSLAKACQAIREQATMVVAALGDATALAAAIDRLRMILNVTAKQNQRKKPSTFELLNDPERLEYSLT